MRFALLATWLAAFSMFGQFGPSGMSELPKPVPRQNPGFQMGVAEGPSQMLSEDATGSTVINGDVVNQRNTFGTIQVRGREYMQAGDSTSAVFGTRLLTRPLFGAGSDLRQYHHGPPGNAEFQAGPLYVKLYDLTSSLLVSDNVNFVPNNARWGALAELRLRLAGILQITPAWRLVVSGSIIYLPFNNQFGVEGFGIGDALNFVAGEGASPTTHIQLAYNTLWGNWRLQMMDDAIVRYFSINGGYNAFLNGDEQPEGVFAEDVAGRYVFANGTTIPNQAVDQRQRDFIDIRTFLQLQNTVAGVASTVVPTETAVSIGANHTDFWFSGGDWGGGTNGLGLSNYSVDRAFIFLRNQRESMRFKPFAYFEAYRYNYDPDWTRQLGVGITGPITDNLFLEASGGYLWGGATLLDRNREFYRIRLTETPNPYTRQTLSYTRMLTEPVREITDTYRYTISQVLGPNLLGRLYAQRSVFQPEQAGVYESVEDRVATRITWRPTLHHAVLLGGNYAENRFANFTRDRETTWEANAEIWYQYKPSLRFSLLYRYQNINTRQSRLERDIAENLWILSARKFF
jgi:hypothetical protein